MTPSHPDFLSDGQQFKKKVAEIHGWPPAAKQDLLAQLEAHMKSSAWATKALFKPGIRDLYLQEQLGARSGKVKQFEHFLGDQEYLFKFFFQNFFNQGEIPGIIDLLKQGINLPSFRYRLESIDMLVELEGANAIPGLYNLVSGLDIAQQGARDVVTRIDACLDELSTASEASPKANDLLFKLRLLLMQLDAGNSRNEP
nr:hypothetical protein [Candidatus Sigynarchaeota archaeon]